LTLIVTLAAPTIPPSFYERGVTFPRFHRHLQKWENADIGCQDEHEDTTVLYGVQPQQHFNLYQNLDRHHAANVTAMEHYDFLRFSFPSVVAQA
jgi:hypothetical protein